MNGTKLALLDRAVSEQNIRSFADLGGVWGVNGFYSRYTLQKHPEMRGYLVDNLVDSLTETTFSLPNLTTIKGSFDSATVLSTIKFVDMVIMFDVLLHQANPSWSHILSLYAKKTRCFAIQNPQFDLPKSVRLVDLGKTEYFKHIPHGPEAWDYGKLFLDDTRTDPEWRDHCNFWQWAITDQDLISVMGRLSYRLIHREDHGVWPGSAISRSFLFVREGRFDDGTPAH